MSSEALERAREQLRRACEDGERLYRKRMHDEPTITDDNRIDGILTYDLTAALGTVDTLVAALAVARERNQRLREKIEHVIADSPGTPATVKQFLRAALVDEPAAAESDIRASIHPGVAWVSTPDPAVLDAPAAADEPGETP